MGEPSSRDDFTYPDALPGGPLHRRGAGLNPANRFESVRLHVLGEELDRRQVERREAGDRALPRIERTVYGDRTQTVLNRVARTSDVPFDWTLNPYRGCEHGCVYCFARPFHEYLGWNCGVDFETKLTAKPDAPELLRRELAAPGWKGEPIVMSAITDIYQPIEHEFGIARRCLEVLAECGQPVSTMTKSALVLRDADLWARLASQRAGKVTVTLVTLDSELAQSLEPRATNPSGRLRIIRELTRAGVPVSVNVAPVIPGLTDTEMPRILEAAAEAGATHAAWIMLRLPYQLKEIFGEWLRRSVHSERAKKVESMLRQMHDGKLYRSRAETRGRGTGAFAAQIASTFDLFTRRYGLNRERQPLSSAGFRRPEVAGQMRLF